MDADMVIMTMPDLQNFHIKRSYVRKDVEYVYVPHGLDSLNLTMRTGSVDHYDAVLCVGPNQKEEIKKTEEVYKRAQQMAKKGRAMTFQWRGGYLTREVLQELLELIRKAGEERQKTARISLNWPQAVIHFSYVENAGIPEPEVVMEDANEGEQFDTGE